MTRALILTVLAAFIIATLAFECANRIVGFFLP